MESLKKYFITLISTM